MKKSLVIFLVFLTVNAQLYAAVDAFPTAQGFGAKSVGGRGGKVIEVTNLNDAGAGSFRAAVTASGPRTIVFKTGGTITLNSTVTVTQPFLTIAGQTAPGGGICLRNAASLTKPPLIISAHDITARHFRVRPGPSTAATSGLDGLRITGSQAYNVILDHVSVSWAVDENMPISLGCHDVTVQWCIVSEGLYKSVHPSGPHSRGVLIREGAKRITVHHNLIAHHEYRNPQIGHGSVDAEFINNITYNWIKFAVNGNTTSATDLLRILILGNTFKKGPNSSVKEHEITIDPGGGGPGQSALYVKGNIGPYRTSDSQPDANSVAPDDVKWMVATPPFPPSMVATAAAQAFNDVLSLAGCRVPMLDSVDQRVLNDARNGTGKVIDNPSQVGGWPVLASGTPTIDSDHDGMPDVWERDHGLNPNDPSDGPKLSSNGYTNLENYLNSGL